MTVASCDYLLINSSYLFPVMSTDVEDRPMYLLSEFFVQSGCLNYMPFSDWLFDLIAIDLPVDASDSTQQFVLSNAIKNKDMQVVILSRIFPYSFTFNRSNWDSISQTLRRIVASKKNKSERFFVIEDFETHEELFSANVHTLLRV